MTESYRLTETAAREIEEIDPESSGEANTDGLFRYDEEKDQYIYNRGGQRPKTTAQTTIPPGRGKSTRSGKSLGRPDHMLGLHVDRDCVTSHRIPPHPGDSR